MEKKGGEQSRKKEKRRVLRKRRGEF
jgi:hypothetical protein